MATTAGTAGISVRGPRVERQDEALTPDAPELLAELHRRFDARRQQLLARRQELRPRPTSPTAAWRSPGRPSARCSSTP